LVILCDLRTYWKCSISFSSLDFTIFFPSDDDLALTWVGTMLTNSTELFYLGGIVIFLPSLLTLGSDSRPRVSLVSTMPATTL
jgi:hypothetical protein